MDRLKTWGIRFSFVAVTAGALLSRDACLGSSRPPPPSPAAQPTATATAEAAPAPSSTFATPP